MTLSVNITKRERKRKLKSGQEITHTRYVVNYREPRTNKRKQLFFERQKDAVTKRNDLLTSLQNGLYVDEKQMPTIEQVVNEWLADRSGEVKERTMKGYRQFARLIIGPMLVGTPEERAEHTATGKKPVNARFIPMLGSFKINDITTADIRAWHKTLSQEVGAYSANRAKQFLGTALALAAENYNIRPPALPRRIGREKQREKKTILIPDQVAVLLQHAQQDEERGIYSAFLFLSGCRPSEMLALLWEDVDLENRQIHIRRMQEPNGDITNFTKTEAGTRTVPISGVLHNMLLKWKLRCPRLNGELHRVFPGPGRLQPWPLPRNDGGGPLLYSNFRLRFWKPLLDKSGVPYVTPHSARHSFISTLQAQGFEVGLVAKLAGHSSASTTLAHYTQSVRGGEEAISALDRAFGS